MHALSSQVITNAIKLSSDRHSVSLKKHLILSLNQFPLSCHLIFFLCSPFVQVFYFFWFCRLSLPLPASLLACHTPDCFHLRLIVSTPALYLGPSLCLGQYMFISSQCRCPSVTSLPDLKCLTNFCP